MGQTTKHDSEAGGSFPGQGILRTAQPLYEQYIACHEFCKVLGNFSAISQVIFQKSSENGHSPADGLVSSALIFSKASRAAWNASSSSRLRKSGRDSSRW